jgi:flagellar biosynthesis/type III secretory pathway chaperone
MKNLMTALEIQLKLLEELRDVLKKETGELAEVHLDAMSEINAQKEDLAVRIQSHAPDLQNAIKEASAREGLSSRAALGELAASLSKKGNREVARFHAKLNATADQTKELLALNREIAEKFAASIGNTLDFIARIINQTSTYGASGIYQQRPSGAVLINREA